MKNFLQDLSFAFRQLRRAPGFAFVAIVTLALAIGVSTAVFSVLDATLIRPLPYNNPDRLVRVQTFSAQGYGQPAAWLEYQDWRKLNTTLEALAGYDAGTANLESSHGAAAIKTVNATDNFFDVFAVKPIAGRTFLPGEDQPGHNDVAVLSYEAWQQDFAGAKDAIGSTVRIDGLPTTVIGIMPAGFRYPLAINRAYYRPFHLLPQRLTSRGQHFMPTVGRLKPGVTQAAAQSDMAHVFADLGRTYPQNAGRRANVVLLSEYVLGKTTGPLRFLTGSVFGVLLIGCVNIAGLLLARGVRRQGEFALRTALGAGRNRLTRQLLTESTILSLAGAAAGVLFALGLLQLLRQLLVHALARGADIHINLTVLAATVVIALIASIVSGILPALQGARLAPAQALRSGGGAGVSRAQNRLRGSLIIAQVAIALSLLFCSGMLLRQLQKLRSTALGFTPQGLLNVELDLTPANYTGRDMSVAFYQPLLDRVRAIPGVTSASVINMLPIQESGSNSEISIIGKPPLPAGSQTLAETRWLLPSALETIGAKLVAGRAANPSLDRPGAPLNATVNQAFVHKFFLPGEPAVGRQINWGDTPVTIVGVYSDLRQELTQAPLAEMDYLGTQAPAAYSVEVFAHMNLVLRTTGDAASYERPLRDAIAAVDPKVPFRGISTMDQVIADQLQFERLESWLFGIFAALALTLSLVGIYGMVQHEVELRKRDIGIRMALGSTRGRVLAGVLRRVAALMVAGVGLGWVVTFSLKRILSSTLELQPTSSLGLLAALTIGLACFGIAVSLFPARRAAAGDPTNVLRSE